jgi:uncharacterized membrane protein YecN with MAPEG domain
LAWRQYGHTLAANRGEETAKMTVFLICAGILGLLAAVLTINVGRMRGKKRIFLGDGGDAEMTAAIRAHGNLIELAPLCLFLIYLLHGPYGGRMMVVLAVLLVIGRVAHAGGMLGYIPLGRMVGAITSTTVLGVASVMLLVAGIRAF